MIVSAIITLIYGIVFVVTYPLRSLTDVTMSSSFSSSITTANGYISSFNNFVPLDTIGQILTLFLAIEGAVLTYKLIMWLIRRIPTQS